MTVRFAFPASIVLLHDSLPLTDDSLPTSHSDYSLLRGDSVVEIRRVLLKENSRDLSNHGILSPKMLVASGWIDRVVVFP